MQNPKVKVLFLCTGNSCRSQMAEGWAKHLKADEVEAYSAGTKPVDLNPLAVESMNEIGIDISKHHSKSVEDLKDIQFDFVITVCGEAHESCPVFPGKAKVIHQGFQDPPRLAQNSQSKEEALIHYQAVRDQIGEFIKTIPESLMNSN